MMERKMRRFRQELPLVESKQILTDESHAVWAVAGDDDYPYAVPVNYVYDGSAIYIHCARQGHKLDAIRRNPRCSLCVVAKDEIHPEKFTSHFLSVIAFGKAIIVSDKSEILMAMRLLCEKYSPGIDPTDEINKLINAVCMVRIDIETISGKEAIELLRQRAAT